MREELIERDRTTTISPNTVAASVSPIVLNISPLGSWRLRKWATDRRPGPSVTRKSIQFPSVHEFFPVGKRRAVWDIYPSSTAFAVRTEKGHVVSIRWYFFEQTRSKRDQENRYRHDQKQVSSRQDE